MTYDRLFGFSVLVLAGLVVVAARTILELERTARAKPGREGQSDTTIGLTTPVALPSRPSSPLVAVPSLAAGVTHGPGGPPTAGPVSSHLVDGNYRLAYQLRDETAEAVDRLLDLHGMGQ